MADEPSTDDVAPDLGADGDGSERAHLRPEPVDRSGTEPAAAEPETPSGLAWAITTRLNRFTRKFLGPAQVGDRAPDTHVPDSLPSTPCSVCGRPLTEHELVRTADQKMRLYCPARSS